MDLHLIDMNFCLCLQNDIGRKPQGHITLDGQTRTNKTDGGLAFEVRFVTDISSSYI